MQTLRDMQDVLVDLLEEAQALAEAIAEADEPSEEDEAELERKSTEINELRAKIAKREKLEERRAQFAEERTSLTAPRSRFGAAPGTETRRDAAPVIEFAIPSRPTAFARAFPHLDLHEQCRLAKRTGMYMTSVLGKGEQAERAARWCKDHEVRAMVGSTNSAGGYLVPEETAATILANQLRYGVARSSIGDIWPMRAPKTKVPSLLDGFVVYYPEEAGDIDESDLTFGEVQLDAVLMGILGKISRSLFHEDSAIALGNLCADQIARKFAAEEDLCIFTGSAANKMEIDGIVTQLTTGTKAGLVTAKATHISLDKIDPEDITKVTGRLPAFEGIDPAWYCHKEVAEQVFTRLKMSMGGYVDTAAGPTFLGYPIRYVHAMQKGTAHSQTVLLFGDIRMAVAMGQIREIEIAQSEHVFFKSDSVGIRGTQRTAAKVYGIGDNTNAGAMVGLKLAAS